MGVLDRLSDIFDFDVSRPRKKRKPTFGHAGFLPSSSPVALHSNDLWFWYFLSLLFKTVDIKVKMDCDGCERRVRNAISSIYHHGASISYDVKSAEVNRKQSKVTVSGNVEAGKVLNKVKSTGKKAELWPYVPYNLVAYPYARQAYDKKAPSGYVKNVPQALPSPNAPDEQFTTVFSDKNPNACSIM
ncbi:hypothetical protein NL676_014553 [Syzygium grande]|nr:hypothetical protein NL676_014553 [Syzygium grande]